jgi:hypothetical protein
MAAEPHCVPARNDLPALDDLIIIALRRISQAVDTYSRQLLQEFGLTAPQIGALRALQREQLIGPGQLAERLHLSSQTMAGIVSRLEQRGLVTRTRSEGTESAPGMGADSDPLQSPARGGHDERR